MNRTIISKESKRYKGNLHSHTTNSDGHLTPVQAKELFKGNGYSFLALTDHDIYTDYTKELNDEEFIILPAVEASANLVSNAEKKLLKTHHMLGIKGTKDMQKKVHEPFIHLDKLSVPLFDENWQGLDVAQNLVNELRAKGLIVIYNHPVWSRVELEEFCDLEGILGIETFNYNTVNECALGSDFVHYDEMLRKGKTPYCFATDDNHNDGTFKDACGGYIVVIGSRLTHDDIIQNIIEGNFYASSGVEIKEIKEEDGYLTVACSEVNRINFIADGKIGDGRTIMCDDYEDTMTDAKYEIKGSERSIRIECIDKYGRAAWSNPIYFK